MEKTWFCQFKEREEPITVGAPFTLLCDGEPLTAPLKEENLSLQSQPDYSLVLLKSLKTEKNFLAIQAASYRTGSFESPFYITDGEQLIRVENLSFQVQSLLTEKDQKPHPAFGPFLTQQPYFLFSAFFAGCFAVLLSLFFYRFFKRTRFVKKASGKALTPSKAFILKLRQEEGDGATALIRLEKSFRAFLEEQLLIPAQNQKIEKIMKNIKKYQPQLYKKSGLRIKQLLKEFSERGREDTSYRKLKNRSQELVFFIEGELK